MSELINSLTIQEWLFWIFLGVPLCLGALGVAVPIVVAVIRGCYVLFRGLIDLEYRKKVINR